MNGQITIDEAAANADIQKINAAIEKLKESQNSIKQLQGNASLMVGQTGSAIVEKCGALSSQIDSLLGNLNAAARLIRRTVNRYKETDQQIAASIMGMGGIS